MDEELYKERVISKLKELRRKDKLNQKEFAEKCGISYSAVTKYESGSQMIGLIAALKICAAYNTSIGELIGEEVSGDTKKTKGFDAISVCEGLLCEGLENASVLSLFGLGASLVLLDSYIGEMSGPNNEDEFLLRLRSNHWDEAVRRFEGLMDIGESYSVLDKIEAIGKIVRSMAPKLNEDFDDLIS